MFELSPAGIVSFHVHPIKREKDKWRNGSVHFGSGQKLDGEDFGTVQVVNEEDEFGTLNNVQYAGND